MRLLGPTGVPVPAVLAEDPGSPPDVPPLFVMEFRPGESVEPLFDMDGAGPDPVTMGERLRQAAAAMAELHRLAPAGLGLGAEPVIGAADEIDRWSRLLETVDQALVPGWEAVADRLRASLPGGAAPAVVHGDFRLGNLLSDGTRINAVIDWEIWSVGDPRVDAGWFLANADPATYQRPTRYAGRLPPADELAAVYRDHLGRAVPDLAWFVALALFKSAATWSLIVKHNRRRPAPDAAVEALVAVLPHLLARALAKTA